jgi:hypothetical protein
MKVNIEECSSAMWIGSELDECNNVVKENSHATTAHTHRGKKRDGGSSDIRSNDHERAVRLRNNNERPRSQTQSRTNLIPIKPQRKQRKNT